jgi:SAM-dependent methyltransferase
MNPPDIPYFDALIKLVADDEDFALAFGRNVHWGYWEEAPPDAISLESFVAASNRLTARTLAEARLGDHMRILDAGCGFGGTIGTLNQELHDCTLIGINIDDRQLERARSQIRPQNGNRVELIEMDANTLEFSEPFDVVIAIECIFHFNRPLFFQHVRRLLKPSGRLVITDFIVNPGMSFLFKIVDLLTRQATLATFGEIDLSYSTKRYLRSCRKAGLKMVRDLDITSNTFPTYRFVLPMAERAPDRIAAAHFKRATKSLQIATRTGILGYHIMGLAHGGDH